MWGDAVIPMEDLQLAYEGAKQRLKEYGDTVSDLRDQVDAGRNIIARAHMGTPVVPRMDNCCEHIGHAEVHAMNLIRDEAAKIKKEREA